MKMSKPTLSVILPVYNTRLYLEQCLQSLEKQTLTNMEVIMVNDGSTDGSEVLLQKQAMLDKRFRYIAQKNEGLSVARNTGMRYAEGDYLFFLDSDDWLATDSSLEDLCMIAQAANADVAVGHTLSIYPDGNTFLWGVNGRKVFAPNEAMSGEDFFVATKKYDCYVPMVYNYLYRLSFLKKNGFAFEPNLIHEDELWTPIVLTSACRVVYTDIIHYYYRQRENSIMTATSVMRKIASLQIIVEKLLEYASQYHKENVVKSAVCLQVLHLYWVACCLQPEKEYTKLYDKAGSVLGVCEQLQREFSIGCWYKMRILHRIRNYINWLQGQR